MIYLDNAATTYPKPVSVLHSAEKALYDYGANPGRSGHRLSLETSRQVFYAREKCAEFFGGETENTVFTLNLQTVSKSRNNMRRKSLYSCCTHKKSAVFTAFYRTLWHMTCEGIEKGCTKSVDIRNIVKRKIVVILFGSPSA